MPNDPPEAIRPDLLRKEPRRGPDERRGHRYEGRVDPDVLLDVPVLKVEAINLDVEDLRARVSLETAILDLLRLHVGVDATLGKVNLDIAGVEAKALLKVRLDNVAMIVRDVLRTIDNNPQIIENLTAGARAAVHEVGRGTGRAVGELGRSTGPTLGAAGKTAWNATGDARGENEVGEDRGPADEPRTEEQESEAEGQESEAEGQESEAEGQESEAEEQESEAEEQESEAEGQESEAEEQESEAEGGEAGDEGHGLGPALTGLGRAAGRAGLRRWREMRSGPGRD